MTFFPRSLLGRTAITIAITLLAFMAISMTAAVYFVYNPMAKRHAEDFAAIIVSAAHLLQDLPVEMHSELEDRLLEDHGLIVAEQPFRSSNGDLQWTALPQVRIGLTKGGHVALNLGMELPLSGQVWDHSVHLTLLWDFADGSLFKGW